MEFLYLRRGKLSGGADLRKKKLELEEVNLGSL